MADAEPARAPKRPAHRIVINHYTGEPGPCLVVFAGIHGSEHSGVKALERVAAVIKRESLPIRGKLIGLLGNLTALSQGKRFVDRDLNRRWFEEEVEKLQAQDPASDSVEDTEQRELLAFLEEIENEPNQPVIFLDLHSTSGEGPPFACMPDTLQNLRISLEIPIPSILGLEETIEGPLMGLLSDRGYGGVIVEGGQHDDPRTVDVLESSVWILLAAVGGTPWEHIPRYHRHWARMAELGEGLPRVLEIRFREVTEEGDGFRMEPDFQHHDRVKKGQRLATNNQGPITAPESGRIIMPRYEPLGEQGFFIARDVPNLIVKILFLIRKLRLGRFAHLLPGAMRHPDNPNILVISNRVPTRLVNIIRLLGWRRSHADGERIWLRRRRIRRTLG